MRGTAREPMHIRFGQNVHYGRGKKTHIGVKTEGGPAHFYRNRIWVGTAQKGEGRRLTAEEQARVGGLFDELERINAVRDARRATKTAEIEERLVRIMEGAQ